MTPPIKEKKCFLKHLYDCHYKNSQFEEMFHIQFINNNLFCFYSEEKELIIEYYWLINVIFFSFIVCNSTLKNA